MDAIVLHHIFTALDFHPVEANLRECFRLLAFERERGDVLEVAGVTIASAGVAFQMFNAAFLNGPVETAADFERRIEAAARHFAARRLRWSFWLCEDWIPKSLRRKAGAIFQRSGLYLSAEMPGMAAEHLGGVAVPERGFELRQAFSGAALRDFREIGALCFHVPPAWFGEVFDSEMARRPGFLGWVAYQDGVPIGTAAAVVAAGVTGLYNIAVLPEYRRRGYGSAITRLAVEAAMRWNGGNGVILQASTQGLRIYERMGFRTVTRVLVYNSV
jgi:ribosomal protein S18 acetylase RimI-like enzyme